MNVMNPADLRERVRDAMRNVQVCAQRLVFEIDLYERLPLHLRERARESIETAWRDLRSAKAHEDDCNRDFLENYTCRKEGLRG